VSLVVILRLLLIGSLKSSSCSVSDKALEVAKCSTLFQDLGPLIEVGNLVALVQICLMWLVDLDKGSLMRPVAHYG